MPLPLRVLVSICLATAAWSVSFGLGSQLVSLWFDSRGASDTVIGLAHAFYYLGLAVGSLLVPALVRRWHNLVPIVGLVATGLSLAIFPHLPGEVGWLASRFVNGLASALTLVPLETLVSRESAPHQRTRNFACYAVALTLGGAAGIWLVPHVYEVGASLPFWVGGVVPLFVALPLSVALRGIDYRAHEASVAHVDWRDNFLTFATCWWQGFLEGGMMAFLLLYLNERGMSQNVAGTLMSATMVGVILFQVPVGWLADRLGKLPMLLGCYAAAFAGLMLVPWCEQATAIGVWLFVLGACAALYPLGLAMLGDRVPEGALVRAYSWVLALECVGSLLGSAAIGYARDRWGRDAMFVVSGGAMIVVLALAALLDMGPGGSDSRPLRLTANDSRVLKALPPCGGGFGWGVAAPKCSTPTLALPRKGGGNNPINGTTAMVRAIIVVAFTLASGPDVPPDAAIDRHALLAPMDIEQKVERLADYLVQPAKTERDKARAIFRWVTDRIQYDIDALMTEHPGEVRPDAVLRSRKARSGGYAALFEALARRAGLEVAIIPGYVQGMTAPDEERRIRPNHAWNAVKIDGRWQLVDATLGAGHVRGQRFRKVLQEQFFLPPPQHLILTHLPADVRWQLLPMPFHPAAWQHMPYVDQQLLSMGVTLETLCRQMQAPGFRGFVNVHAQHTSARVWAAPLGKELAPGYDYWFVIDAPDAAQLVLVQKNRTVPLRRNGTRFEGMIRPEPGELKLNVQRRAGDRNLGTMFTYKVNDW